MMLLSATTAYQMGGGLSATRHPAVSVRHNMLFMKQEEHAKVIFLRHGQSVWNEASLFTGWADVELTTLGKNEAATGATAMWQEGIQVDVAFTSLLKRAQQTLDIVSHPH